MLMSPCQTILKKLHCFNHTAPNRPQKSPHKWDRPVYGAHIQYVPEDTNSTLLLPPKITRVQKIVGNLLFYAQVIDITMLVTLNSSAAEQSNTTAETAEACNCLLDYAVIYPNTSIRYHASKMRILIESNAS